MSEADLFVAIKNGELPMINKLITLQDIDVNCQVIGETPLSYATERGMYDVCSLLINLHADVNGLNAHYRSVLATACRYGYADIVRLLLKNNADLLRRDPKEQVDNAVNRNSFVRSFYSFARGFYDFVTRYAGLQPDIKPSQRRDPHCVLAEAVRSRCMECVRVLIENNAEINTTPTFPVIVASSCGSVGILSYLVDHNADVHAIDQFGVTSISAAAENGHVDVVQYLLGLKANVDTLDNQRETPLHKAAKNGQLHMVIALLENGADVNKQREDGGSALHGAAAAGQTDIVSCLVQHKARVDDADHHQHTPFYYAVTRGRYATASLLLEHRARIHSNSPDYQSPLFTAVFKGKVDTTKWLLEHKALVTIIDENGQTPLFYACTSNKQRQMKRIIP